MEVQKIIENHNKRGEGEDKVILQFADCRKMVNELENQVIALQDTNQELVQKLEQFQSEKTDFQRKITNFKLKCKVNKESIKGSNLTIELLSKSYKINYFKQRGALKNSILVLKPNFHLQNLRKKEFQQISNAKHKVLSENQKLIFQGQKVAQSNAIRVQQLAFQLEKQKQQKQKLMEELLKIQYNCQNKIRTLQQQNLCLRQSSNSLKSEKEYSCMIKDNQINSLNRKLNDADADLQNQMRKAERDRKNWETQKMTIQIEKKQIQESWKCCFEGQRKSRQDLNRRYLETYSNLTAAQRQIEELSNLIKEQQRSIRNYSTKEEQAWLGYEIKIKELENTFRKKQSQLFNRNIADENKKINEIVTNVKRQMNEIHETIYNRLQQEKQADQKLIRNLQTKIKKYEMTCEQGNQETNRLHDQIKLLNIRVSGLQRQVNQSSEAFKKQKQQLTRKLQEQISYYQSRISQETLTKSKQYQIHESQLRNYYEDEIKQISVKLESSKKEALSLQTLNYKIISAKQDQLKSCQNQFGQFNETIYRMNMRIKDHQQELMLKNTFIAQLQNKIFCLYQKQNQMRTAAEKSAQDLKRLQEQKREAEQISRDLMSRSKSKQYEVTSLQIDFAREKTILMNKVDFYEKSLEQINKKLKEKERQVSDLKEQAFMKQQTYAKKQITSQKIIEEVKESAILIFETELQQKQKKMTQLQTKYMQKQNQYSCLSLQLDLNNQQCERLKKKQEILNEEISLKEKENQNLRFYLQNCQQKLVFYQKILKERQSIIESETKRIKMLENQVTHSAQKKSQISEGLKKLSRDYECVLSQKNSLDSITREKDQKIFTLTCQISQIKDQMQSSVSEKSRTQKKLKSQVVQIQSSLNITASGKAKLQQRVNALEILLQEKQCNNTKLQQQIKRLKEACIEKQNQMAQLLKQVRILKDKESQNSFKEQIQMIERDLKEYQQERTKVNEEMLKSKKQKLLLARNIQEINIKMGQLIESEAIAKQQTQRFRIQFFRLQKTIQSLQKEKITIQLEKSEVQNTNFSLTRKVNSLEERIFNFDQQLESLNYRYQKQKRECQDLTMKYSQVKADYQTFVTKLKENFCKEVQKNSEHFRKREGQYISEIERLKKIECQYNQIKRRYETTKLELQEYREKMQEKKKHWQFVFDQSKIFNEEMKREGQDQRLDEEQDSLAQHDNVRTHVSVKNQRQEIYVKNQKHERLEMRNVKYEKIETLDLKKKMKIQEIDSISKFILYSGSQSNKGDFSYQQVNQQQQVLLQYSQDHGKIPIKKASKTDSLNLLAEQSKLAEVSLDKSEYMQSSINQFSIIQPYNKENKNSINIKEADFVDKKFKTTGQAQEEEFYRLMFYSSQ